MYSRHSVICPLVNGNIQLLDFYLSISWMVVTIQLLDFLSVIQITIQLPDKKSGNWMI